MSEQNSTTTLSPVKRDLNPIELGVLFDLTLNPVLTIMGARTRKSKAYQRFSATFVLAERGLITRKHIFGGAQCSITSEGAAVIQDAIKRGVHIETTSEAQRLRQRRREHGSYSAAETCDLCGKAKMVVYYSDEFNCVVCDDCQRKAEARCE